MTAMTAGPAGAAAPGPRLGAPGIYRATVPAPPAAGPVRLDVAGFVGVAPRGPLDEPVAVESWSDYQWRFGGYNGPGLLPYAVHAFFTQGGARAWVLRVAPLPRPPAPDAVNACALLRVTLGSAGGPADVELAARDEGSWGRRLTVRWDFAATRRFAAPVAGLAADLPPGSAPPVGSLLRLRGSGLPPAGLLRWLEAVNDVDGPAGRRRVAVLDQPVPALAEAEVEIVTATVTVTDADPDLGRQERFDDLGLSAAHPRSARRVLTDGSLLVAPAGDWPGRLLPPDPYLTAAASTVVRDGADRWPAITAASFAGTVSPDLLPTGGDEPADSLGPVHGVDRMSLVGEIGLLAVPDLLWDHPEPPRPELVPVTVAPPGPVFAPCPPLVAPMVHMPVPPDEHLLDARAELAEILRRQSRLVALAERQRRFVALLDVPRDLPLPAIARWRAAFDSSYAAAYHPWLAVVQPDDLARRARFVGPSAFAAGIIAERERSLGLVWGPANVLAAEAVGAAAAVSDAEHDELHRLAVDVFRAGPDGFRLTSARTLSSDPDYQQLSVRRLMTMLRLTLEGEARALAFEPHTDALRRALAGMITQVLRELFRAGAFAGASEEEAFFVRCDEALNPPWSIDLGRLVAEVGVAPARPLEYLVLRVGQDAAGPAGTGGGA